MVSTPADLFPFSVCHLLHRDRVCLLFLTIAWTRIADSSASLDDLTTTFGASHGGEGRALPPSQHLPISATSSMAFNTLGPLTDGGNSESKRMTSCMASFPPNDALQLSLPCRPLRSAHSGYYMTDNCLFLRLPQPLTFHQYLVCSTVLKTRQSTEEPLIPRNAI